MIVYFVHYSLMDFDCVIVIIITFFNIYLYLIILSLTIFVRKLTIFNHFIIVLTVEIVQLLGFHYFLVFQWIDTLFALTLSTFFIGNKIAF